MARQLSKADLEAQEKREKALKEFGKKVHEKRQQGKAAHTPVGPVQPTPQTRQDGTVQVGPVAAPAQGDGAQQRAVGDSATAEIRQGAVSVTRPPGQPPAEGATVRAAGPATAQQSQGASVAPSGAKDKGVLLAAQGPVGQRSELRAVGQVQPKAEAEEEPEEDEEEAQEEDESVEAPTPPEAQAADPEATEAPEGAA